MAGQALRRLMAEYKRKFREILSNFIDFVINFFMTFLNFNIFTHF